jgi:hypothetical protein
MIWDFPNICDSCIYSLWVEFSYGPTCRRSQSITQFVWRGHFTRVQGLLERGGYMNCPALEGFLDMRWAMGQRLVFGMLCGVGIDH